LNPLKTLGACHHGKDVAWGWILVGEKVDLWKRWFPGERMWHEGGPKEKMIP